MGAERRSAQKALCRTGVTISHGERGAERWVGGFERESFGKERAQLGALSS